MSASTKLKCAFKLSSANSKKKHSKKQIFRFLPKLHKPLIELARFGVQMFQNGGGGREQGNSQVMHRFHVWKRLQIKLWKLEEKQLN